MNKCKPLYLYSGTGLTAFASAGILLTLVGRPLWYLGAAYWVPVYFFLAVCGALLCAVGGSWRRALVALVCAVAAGCLLLPWHLPGQRRPSSHREPNLRILNANVWESPQAASALADLVKQTQPDIVLIQEIGSGWVDILEPIEALYPHHRWNQRIDGCRHYMGQFSRIPAASHELLAPHGIPGTATTFRVNGVSVHVINAHTNSPFSPRRVRKHRAQMEALTHYLREQDGLVILVGDLNTVMWSPLYRRLTGVTGLVNARKGFGCLGTWPSSPSWIAPLRMPIDHVLVSPDIEVVRCRLGPGIGSDHRPMITDLYIPPLVRQ